MSRWRYPLGTILSALCLAGCAASPGLLRAHAEAETDYHNGNLMAAKQAYERLLRATPGNPVFWARLGNCNALLGDPQAAEADYRKALKIDPQLVKARYNLAILHLKEAKAELLLVSEQSETPPVLKKHVEQLMVKIPDS